MSPAARRPTITDVAAAAGASRSTTSRALSGTGYVSPDVRERVRKAAKRLGYVPDAMARGLKQRTSNTIGLLVSDLRNSFYAQLASGASRAAKQRGYAIMLTDTGGHRLSTAGMPAAQADEIEAADIFLAQRVAGVIVTPVSSAVTNHLTEHQLAVVEVDRTFGSKAADAVTVSNAEGAGEATEHLVRLGHRRIALIIDELDWTTGRQRYAGYVDALRAAGLPVAEDLVVASGWDASDAEHAVRALLQRRDRPTAVFAANNVIAEGAWRAAAELGLTIPAELSLVAFDDAPWMSMVSPGVSTVTQNPEALGEAAVRQLLERIAEPAAPRRQVVLGTELVDRGSTGRHRPITDPASRPGRSDRSQIRCARLVTVPLTSAGRSVFNDVVSIPQCRSLLRSRTAPPCPTHPTPRPCSPSISAAPRSPPPCSPPTAGCSASRSPRPSPSVAPTRC